MCKHCDSDQTAQLLCKLCLNLPIPAEDCPDCYGTGAVEVCTDCGCHLNQPNEDDS